MTTYNKAFEDGMEYEQNRILKFLEEAAEIGAARIPINDEERAERNVFVIVKGG